MSRWLDLYSLAAGACDATTGLLLVAAPALTLQLMGISPAPAEPVFLRFLGVFVGAVGLAYLYPFLLDPARRLARLAVMLEVTALVRLLVGVFVTACLLSGALALPWISVASTDLSLAIIQLVLLGRLRRVAS